MHFTAPGHTAILSLCDGENTGCLRVLCSLAVLHKDFLSLVFESASPDGVWYLCVLLFTK